MKQTILTCFIILLSCAASQAQEDTAYTYTLYRAINLYHAQQYKRSAETFDHAFKMNGGGYNDDRYTAACSWALAGNKKAAFAQLMHIATKGNFTNIDRLLVDDDLESLHSDKRWEKVCAQVKLNKAKAEAPATKKNNGSYQLLLKSIFSKN